VNARRVLVAAAAGIGLLASPVVRASDPLRGADLYQKHCAYCHGNNGRPVLPLAPDFSRQERLLQPDLALLTAIRNGRGAMPAFQGALRDRDILDVIAHLRTLR
jgi:cytochrome c6